MAQLPCTATVACDKDVSFRKFEQIVDVTGMPHALHGIAEDSSRVRDRPGQHRAYLLARMKSIRMAAVPDGAAPGRPRLANRAQIYQQPAAALHNICGSAGGALDSERRKRRTGSYGVRIICIYSCLWHAD
jgi:hypothetical protein